MNRTRLVIVTVLVTLVAAACGSDAEKVALASWVSDANAICADYEARSDDIAEPDTPDEFAAFLEATGALFADQVAELRDLGEPDDRSDEIGELLDSLSEVVDDISELAEQATDTDDLGDILEGLERIGTRVDGLNADADALGLDKCGSDSGDDEDDVDFEVDPELGFAGSAVAAGIAEEGVPLEEAKCIAKALIDELGADVVLQLAELGEEEEPPAEVVSAIIKAAVDCDATEFLRSD